MTFSTHFFYPGSKNQSLSFVFGFPLPHNREQLYQACQQWLPSNRNRFLITEFARIYFPASVVGQRRIFSKKLYSSVIRFGSFTVWGTAQFLFYYGNSISQAKHKDNENGLYQLVISGSTTTPFCLNTFCHFIVH